ncbi:uncharacterized protein RCC_10420 [Ramularia collo-cygni]|uniref:Prion-inhibition and propagation HeLo domain-containing protein n=1 Tax=Ramularia collo-cygni TaxID=112498 RepID=A0A2D3V9J5_9PEZI|nr:uncharacterized protein RCC_10420 [Ramularia collo-cygni]CZT24693.1 uncharacterized protein RCC_10420 [Ramularia collo-cygni]
MSSDKISADHLEFTPVPEHEAQLTGAIALAGLFSNCVEAFGLIHPQHRFDKEEQLLLTRLGLQQARLLIWGSCLGISSPPASVTNHAIPKHPSMVYPDLKEPTFFDPRDARLDEPVLRTTIESTLSTIVDRSAGHSREDMMAKFGLKPPKKFVPQYANTLDMTRLESFREKYELLREVAESFAHINTRRTRSIVHQPWMIADCKKFANFVSATQEKVDYLIELMGVQDRVNLSMRMDIRAFGWHFSEDRSIISQDVSKLNLLRQICTPDYPEYLVAIQQALDNISRESRENNAAAVQRLVEKTAFAPEPTVIHATVKHKGRPGLFKMFKSFGKPRGGVSVSRPSTPPPKETGPERSKSDAGPSVIGNAGSSGVGDGAALGRTRSKSVPSVPVPILADDLIYKLEKLATNTSTIDGPQVGPTISRHDQYHGISRTPTKDLHQGDY